MSLVCSSAVAMLGSLKIPSSSPMSSTRAEQASSCSESYEAADSGSYGDREMILPLGPRLRVALSGMVSLPVWIRWLVVSPALWGRRRFGKLREIARL